GLVGKTTGGDVRVGRRHLLRPENLPCLEIEREKRIAHSRRRIAVVVPGGDIERVVLLVDGRAAPHRGAGGAKQLRAYLVLLSGKGLLRNRERLPDDLAGLGIERDDAAAELAAFVVRRGTGSFLGRRNRYIQPSTMEPWRASETRGWKRLDPGLPQQLAGYRVERVGVRCTVTEVRSVAAPDAANAHSSPHRCTRFEGPVHAPGCGTQRVHPSTRAANEHAPAGNRRLGVGLQIRGKPERPLQLQSRDIGRRQAGNCRILKAGVGSGRAPSAPLRTG